MRLCVSDCHQGLRTAIAKVLGCPWQRCTVHFLRDMLGHCAKSQQPMIAAAIRGIFAADHGQQARERLAEVVERLEPVAPKVAAAAAGRRGGPARLLRASRASTGRKLRSTNPLERVNREIGRRSDVVGIFPNDAALIRLAGMLLIEQSDEWLVAAATSPKNHSRPSSTETITHHKDRSRRYPPSAPPEGPTSHRRS